MDPRLANMLKERESLTQAAMVAAKNYSEATRKAPLLQQKLQEIDHLIDTLQRTLEEKIKQKQLLSAELLTITSETADLKAVMEATEDSLQEFNQRNFFLSYISETPKQATKTVATKTIKATPEPMSIMRLKEMEDIGKVKCTWEESNDSEGFNMTVYVKISDVLVTANARHWRSKREAKAASANMVMKYIEGFSTLKDLTRSGDVELNPGPVTEAMVNYCNQIKNGVVTQDHVKRNYYIISLLVDPLTPTLLEDFLYLHHTLIEIDYPVDFQMWEWYDDVQHLHGTPEEGIEPNPGPPSHLVQRLVATMRDKSASVLVYHLMRFQEIQELEDFDYLYAHLARIGHPAVLLYFQRTYLLPGRNLLAEGIEPNPGPADFDRKESRRKLRQRQNGEKKNSLSIQYRTRIAQCKQLWLCTGDLAKDIVKMDELMEQQGYAPYLVPILPIGLVRSVFRAFEEGYGLQNYNKIVREFQEKKIQEVHTHGNAMKGKKARRILMKYYFIVRHERYPILSTMLLNEHQMFEGLGAGFGKGLITSFKSEIMPLWDELVKKFTSMKDSAYSKLRDSACIMCLGFIAILVGVLGYKTFIKYAPIFTGIPQTKLDNQGFDKIIAWFSWDQFLKTFGFNQMISSFDMPAFEKKIKDLGQLSTALTNIGKVLQRIKDIVAWVLDSVCLFLFKKPCFASTERIMKLQDRVTNLMKLVQQDSVPTGLAPQREFCNAYCELQELIPWLKTNDPIYFQQVNTAITIASSKYRDIHDKIKFISVRQEPVWLYMYSKPHEGKSVLTHHLPRILFKILETRSPDAFKDIGSPKFTNPMIYTRMGEMEFWDRYNNQWTCVFDDLFQSKEMQSAEAFSLIRAKNTADYPLHMASINDKSSTTFQSKLIISSTNLEEKNLAGFPGIQDLNALKRRRDYYIELKRDKTVKCDDIWDPAALNSVTLFVYDVHPSTGQVSKDYREFVGYKGITRFMDDVATLYIQRYNSQKMRAIENEYTEIPKLLEESDDDTEIDGTQPPEESVSDEEDGHSTGSDSDEEYKDAADWIITDEWKAKQAKLSNQCRWHETESEVHEVETLELETVSYVPRRIHLTFVKAYQYLFSDFIPRTAQFMMQKFSELKKDLSGTVYAHRNWTNGVFCRFGVRIKSTKEDIVTALKRYYYKLITYSGEAGHNVIAKNFNTKFSTTIPLEAFYGYIDFGSPLRENVEPDELRKWSKEVGYIMYEDMAALDFDEDDFRRKRRMEVEFRTNRMGRIASILKWSALVGLLVSGGALLAAIGTGMMVATDNQSNAKYFDRLRKENSRRPKMPLRNQYSDPTAFKLIPKVGRNLYVLEVTWGDSGRIVSQFATGITGDTFVTAAHIFKFEKISCIRVYATRDGCASYEQEFKHIRVSEIEGRDLALFTIPGTKNVKSILSHLPTQDESFVGEELVARVDPKDTLEIQPEGTDSTEMYVTIPCTRALKSYKDPVLGEQKVSVTGCYNTTILTNTQFGDCGKAYMSFNTKRPHKVLGFHIAGGHREAIFAPLYREEVERYINKIESQSGNLENVIRRLKFTKPLEHPDDPVKFVKSEGDSFMGMPFEGKTTKAFTWPQKTSLKKTPIASDSFIVDEDGNLQKQPAPFELKNGPAALKGEHLVMKTLEGRLTKRDVWVDDWFNLDNWKGIFNDSLRHCTGRMWTLEEAIKGCINKPNTHSIVRNASSAYPTQHVGKKSLYILTAKEHFEELNHVQRSAFVQIGKECWLHYTIKYKIDQWFKAVDNNKMPKQVFLYCPKDEPRPWDKVRSLASRAFFMGELVFIIITLMIFGDYISTTEENFFETDAAVGINPYSSQWQVMYEQLKTIGTAGFADDGKKYDIHCQVRAYSQAFTMAYIHYFQIPVESKLTKYIYAITRSNLSGILVIKDHCYFAEQNFSGNVRTCNTNSEVNSVENRILVNRMLPKLGIEPTDEHFRHKVFGDDLIQVFSKEVLAKVTPDWIREFRTLCTKLFSYERTNCFKQLGDDKLIELNDMVFLQRSFLQVNGRVYGALSKDSIINMVQWIMTPKDKTFEAQFASNCAQAMLEIVPYGKDEFNKWKKLLNGYLRYYGTSYLYRNEYEEMYEAWYLRSLQSYNH